ncbi:hypothetical protein ACHAQH_004224 [Verticillium albo-atrum]
MPYVMSPTPEPGSEPQSSSRTLNLDKPVPRPPKSHARTREIRAQNRRRNYIERNPEYLESAEHEFAGGYTIPTRPLAYPISRGRAYPLLYEKLVRQYQTPAEREAEGRRKGYSRVLEGDLLRGEARMVEIAQTTSGGPSAASPEPVSSISSDIVTLEADLAAPADKHEARERWHQLLTRRFVHGQDDDFDYDKVDYDESFDAMEQRDAEDAWFEAEEPGWASDRESDDPARRQTVQAGETGVQDF